MIYLDINLRRLRHHREWREILEHMQRETERSLELIRIGEYPPAALVPAIWPHPGRCGLWATGWTIDPDAKRRSAQTCNYWWRALAYMRFLHGTKYRGKFRTFDEALVMVRRRYRSTANLEGFEAAARHAWDSEQRIAGGHITPPLRPVAATTCCA